MAFDFPNPSSVGQEFTPVAGTTYVWNGTAWVLNPSSIKGFTIVPRVFTASANYVPTAGLVYAVVELVAGGGGGGGAVASPNTFHVGGGGGSGGYSRRTLTATQIGASQTVTIGAGGIGGNPGTTGGLTSFGSLVIANGGGGGTISSVGALPTAGVGGPAGVGDLIATGSPGHAGFMNATTSAIDTRSGAGGSSFFGGGASNPMVNSQVGNAGSNYGGGGGGAGSFNSDGGFVGGNGAPGVCYVTEYVGNQPLVGGNVSAAGAPSAGQLAVWTGATAIQGVSDAGRLVLISTQTVSAAVTMVTFTSGIDATYDEYEVHLFGVKFSTADNNIWMRVSTDGGATWRSGLEYSWASNAIGTDGIAGVTNALSGNQIIFSGVAQDNIGNSSAHLAGKITFWVPASNLIKMFMSDFVLQSSSRFARIFSGGRFAAGGPPVAAVNGLQFFPGAGGNFTAGTFNLYGVKK